jgi:hypothetical protein
MLNGGENGPPTRTGPAGLFVPLAGGASIMRDAAEPGGVTVEVSVVNLTGCSSA